MVVTNPSSFCAALSPPMYIHWYMYCELAEVLTGSIINVLGSLWTAGLFLVNLIKLLIHQSCPSFDVIFAARIESESLGRFLVAVS